MNVHVLTNIGRLAGTVEIDGIGVHARHAADLGGMLRQWQRTDLILIHCNPDLVLKLAAGLKLLPRSRRPALIASDLVLRQPETLWECAGLGLKRRLLAGVDHFIHHFRDLSGYEKFFGIGPERSTFVPFKPNLRGSASVARVPAPEGEYILCFGWSLRDYDTFFAAVERLPYPAAIVHPDVAQLRRHGSRFTRRIEDLPPHLHLLDHIPASAASQIDVLRRARLVVLPLLKSCLVGVGSALNAMYLGKCVIMSEGPATRGLYDQELLTVPPEDPVALADLLDRAWRDDVLRARVAAAGQAYAWALGGTGEMVQRLLTASVRWWITNRQGTRRIEVASATSGRQAA